MCSNYAIRENSKRSSRALPTVTFIQYFCKDLVPGCGWERKGAGRVAKDGELRTEGGRRWAGRDEAGGGGGMKGGRGRKGEKPGQGGSREGAQGMGHAGEQGKELGRKRCKQRPATWRQGWGGSPPEGGRRGRGRMGGGTGEARANT